MNEVTVTVRVLPHVRKFLERIYPGQYRLDQCDHFGRQLTILVEEAPAPAPYRLSDMTVFGMQTSLLLAANRADRQYDDAMARYTDTWRVTVPAHLRKHFTSRVTVRFNQLVDSEIKLRLYAHAEALTRHKVLTREAAVYDFMEMYGFTQDEVNFRTLLKSLQRDELRRLGVKKKRDLAAGRMGMAA